MTRYQSHSQVDGVAERLIDGGQLAAGEGPVERVRGPLPSTAATNSAAASAVENRPKRGVGELAVHLDGRFALEGVAFLPPRPGRYSRERRRRRRR